jgi:hypothetical protein
MELNDAIALFLWAFAGGIVTGIVIDLFWRSGWRTSGRVK